MAKDKKTKEKEVRVKINTGFDEALKVTTKKSKPVKKGK